MLRNVIAAIAVTLVASCSPHPAHRYITQDRGGQQMGYGQQYQQPHGQPGYVSPYALAPDFRYSDPNLIFAPPLRHQRRAEELARVQRLPRQYYQDRAYEGHGSWDNNGVWW